MLIITLFYILKQDTESVCLNIPKLHSMTLLFLMKENRIEYGSSLHLMSRGLVIEVQRGPGS